MDGTGEEEAEVYVDVLILKNDYFKPAKKLYNKLSQQEFIRNYSDYTELDVKTEQVVQAFDKLTMDYSGPPVAVVDPSVISSSLVDIEILNNYQGLFSDKITFLYSCNFCNKIIFLCFKKYIFKNCL